MGPWAAKLSAAFREYSLEICSIAIQNRPEIRDQGLTRLCLPYDKRRVVSTSSRAVRAPHKRALRNSPVSVDVLRPADFYHPAAPVVPPIGCLPCTRGTAKRGRRYLSSRPLFVPTVALSSENLSLQYAYHRRAPVVPTSALQTRKSDGPS